MLARWKTGDSSCAGATTYNSTQDPTSHLYPFWLCFSDDPCCSQCCCSSTHVKLHELNHAARTRLQVVATCARTASSNQGRFQYLDTASISLTPPPPGSWKQSPERKVPCPVQNPVTVEEPSNSYRPAAQDHQLQPATCTIHIRYLNQK